MVPSSGEHALAWANTEVTAQRYQQPSSKQLRGAIYFLLLNFISYYSSPSVIGRKFRITLLRRCRQVAPLTRCFHHSRLRIEP